MKSEVSWVDPMKERKIFQIRENRITKVIAKIVIYPVVEVPCPFEITSRFLKDDDSSHGRANRVRNSSNVMKVAFSSAIMAWRESSTCPCHAGDSTNESSRESEFQSISID